MHLHVKYAPKQQREIQVLYLFSAFRLLVGHLDLTAHCSNCESASLREHD